MRNPCDEYFERKMIYDHNKIPFFKRLALLLIFLLTKLFTRRKLST